MENISELISKRVFEASFILLGLINNSVVYGSSETKHAFVWKSPVGFGEAQLPSELRSEMLLSDMDSL